MLRTAKQLQAEASAFAPCPQDKTAVRSWIEAAQAKANDADIETVSLGTRFEAACDAAFDRLDAIREVRNQKYAGIERTAADLRDAKAALEDFSSIAVQWLQASHAALLK